MVKKISALVLALVICLSVVVMPMSVSAAKVELNGQDIAFAFEWDQAYYHPGDTAYLSIYMDANDDLTLYTGSFVFGLSSTIFDPTADEHQNTALQASATMAEWFNAYYKAPDQGQVTQLATKVVAQVQAANTEEENKLYDWYIKFTAGKNSAGWHENSGTTKNGFYGSDFNPNEPILVIPLKVREDAQKNVSPKAAITSGSVKMEKNVQTTWKYFTTPGTATTTLNVVATAISTVKADTPVAVKIIDKNEIVSPLKGQIRFASKESFDVRALAVVSNAEFTELFGSEEAATTMIKEVGFVFATGSNVENPDMTAVKNYVENGVQVKGYLKESVGYISTSLINGGYGFSCIVKGLTTANKGDSLIAVGYMKYEKDGQTYYEYYSAAQSVSIGTLYDTYVNSAFPA